ncbi:MAG: preprotein translocase subunit SecG [Candidatus Paceibacterota bacterium]
MNQTLLIIQAVVATLLIIFIVLQQRGTALGSAFGGGGEAYSTRRGIEKNLYWATIIFIVAFIALAIVNLVK